LRLRFPAALGLVSALVGAPLAALVGVVTGAAACSNEARGRRAGAVIALLTNAAVVLLFVLVACAFLWLRPSGASHSHFNAGP